MNSAWAGPTGQLVRAIGSCFDPTTKITLDDGKEYEMQNIPSVGQYVVGLTKIRSSITDLHIKAFQAHYQAPNYSATANF